MGLWGRERGQRGVVGGSGEKWPLIPIRFLSLWLELFVHSWQIVFSGGCGLMEMGLFLKAVDSLEFAKLS